MLGGDVDVLPFLLESKMLTKFHDEGVIERVQDVEPILNDCKVRHNENMHGSSDTRHAARIPNIIIEKYCNTHGITFHEFMNNEDHVRNLLNDPALSHFRIWKGRI